MVPGEKLLNWRNDQTREHARRTLSGLGDDISAAPAGSLDFGATDSGAAPVAAAAPAPTLFGLTYGQLALVAFGAWLVFGKK